MLYWDLNAQYLLSVSVELEDGDMATPRRKPVPVDALLFISGLVLLFLVSKVIVQSSPPARPLVGRYAEATARSALVHVDHNDASAPRNRFDFILLHQDVPLGRSVLNGTTGPPNPDDPRRPLEGDEHDADASVAGLM